MPKRNSIEFRFVGILGFIKPHMRAWKIKKHTEPTVSMITSTRAVVHTAAA